MAQKRNSIIDIAKGIGIFTVILGHLVRYPGVISTIIFSFHMPLFYCLAGYVMPDTRTRTQYFYRITSLFLPYLEFACLGFVVTLCIPQYREKLTLKGFLYEFVYNTQPECLHVGQIWFLISLIGCVTLFYIIHTLFNDTVKYILIISFVCYIVSVLTSVLPIRLSIASVNLRFPFKADTALAAILFFEFGYWFKKIKGIDRIQNMAIKKKSIVFFLSFIIFIGAAIFNRHVNIASCKFNNPFLYLLGSISGIIFIFILASLLDRISIRKPFAWGGITRCQSLLSIPSIYTCMLLF